MVFNVSARTTVSVLCTTVLAFSGAAVTHADATDASMNIEVPILVYETSDDEDQTGTESEADLTQMVLSAAKRVQSVQDSASIVTVVTRSQIQVRGYKGFSDLLDDIPGFEGYRPTFYFDTSESFARGNARTVLVLWNGIPLNSPQTNQRAFGPYLPMGVVDRVEVVSGPGGVLWGANAVLGVASITTMRADSMTSSAEATGSIGAGPNADGDYRASATIATSFFRDRLKVFANIGLITRSGPVITPPYDLQVGPFPSPDSDATFQLGPQTGSAQTHRDLWVPLTLAVDMGNFKLDVLYPLVAHEYREFNDFGGRTDHLALGNGMIIPGLSSQRRENVVAASLRYEKRLSDRQAISSKVYYTGFEDTWGLDVKYAPGLLSPEPFNNSDTYRGMTSWLHDGAYRTGFTVDDSLSGERSQLIFGGEAFVEGIRQIDRTLSGAFVSEPIRSINAGQRVVTALFADDEINLSKQVSVDVGARAQYSPDSYDPILLGSFAARWNPYKKLNVKFNVAQGFRPPAFELTNGNNDFISNPYHHRQGNPDLQPERSLSAEGELSAVVLQDTKRIRYAAWRVGYQYTRLDDLVIFDPAGKPVNASRRLMSSIELRSDVAFTGGHRLVLGYAFLRGVDLETGPLRNIPEHRLNLTLEQHVYNHVDMYVGFGLTGAVEDLNRLPVLGPNGYSQALPSSVVVDRLPPFALVGFGVVASGLMDGSLDIAAHVQNVFNNHQYIADPDFERRQAIFPMAAPGRGATVSLTWRI